MKQVNFKTILVALLVTTGVFATSCKSKKTNDSATSTDTTVTMSPPVQEAPVVVNEDDAINKGIADATKDYPGVTATVANGEITLTGEIQRSKLPDLMQSLSTLNAKKINNNLTIK